MTTSSDAMALGLFELSIGPHGPRTTSVLRFRGKERISTPFSFEITVAISGAHPDQVRADLLGAPARLTIRGEEGQARRIQGIVRSVEAVTTEAPRDRSRFVVRLVPTLWLLGRKRTSRIFQDKTVPEIIGEILRDSNIEASWSLSGSYEKRAYCVQYDETDLHFMSRLLAEEGIFYFIADPGEDEVAREVVTFADAAPRTGDEDGCPRLPFRSPSGLRGAESAVESFALRDQVRSGSLLLKPFDFRRPLADLTSTVKAPRAGRPFDETSLRVYESLQGSETGVAGATTNRRLEQVRADIATGFGETRSRLLAPGRRFMLHDHPDEAFNAAYAVIEVKHEGRHPEALGGDASDEVYKASFACLPVDIVPRPARPRRRIRQAMETATVVGPKGEEIHTDELGRIKVQFHWDLEGAKNERSSCWLRVMQPWAGAAWGAQFIPRVGMEVVISFAGGDPDHPMVLGCVPNAVHPPPFPLPAGKTQSGIRTRSSPGGEGYNELRFDDAAGRERIHLRAQRDLEEVIEHDHRRSVQGEEFVTVGGNREVSIAGDHVRTVLGSEVATIEKDLVLHVVGRQIIRIEGKSGAEAPGARGTGGPGMDPGAFAGASLAGDEARDEAPLEKGGSPGAAPIPFAVERAAELPREVVRAVLTYLVAQLPDDIASQGEGIEQAVDAAMAKVSELREQVSAAQRQGGEQGREATEASRGELLEKGIRSTKEAIALALSTATAATDDRIATIRAVAFTMLRGAVAEVDDIALRGLLGGVEGPRRGGSAEGGGGAVKQHAAYTMSFQSADKNGLPTMIETAGGSILEIAGGGKIVSPDGFKIEAGGCSIEMAGGVVTITGAQVILKGAPIRLND